MTFEEWYATQQHRLSNKEVCRVIWDAATEAEREAIIASIPGGTIVDPQHICDMIRERSNAAVEARR